MTWADDSTRRIDLLCPIDFSIFLQHYIRPSLFQQASKRLELRIPDLFSFVTSRTLSFNVSLFVFFLGNLARRWSTRWFNYQDWYILLLLFIPVHIYTRNNIHARTIQEWLITKLEIPPNKLFQVSLPIALPRETMTRLSNSTDSRSLPNAGPAN